MIRKDGPPETPWCLYTKDGSRKLGCHATEQEAHIQESIIERGASSVFGQISVEEVERICRPCADKMRAKNLSALKVAGLAAAAPDIVEALDLPRPKMAAAAAHRMVLAKMGGAALRTGSFEGQEHLIVPVVALVEGVIFASNAKGPELVLAEEFKKAYQGWNGRPVVGDHPESDGEKVSANTPEMLDRESFGIVFNAQVTPEKLTMEAWLNPVRAKRVGRAAERVVERVRAGEVVDVSVGTFVLNEETAGTWKDGKEYIAIWRDIVPDHLAMLSEGTPGACSVEMGCGAPRAAATAKDPKGAQDGGDTMNRAERIRALLRSPRVAKGNGVLSALAAASDEELATLVAAAEKGELGRPDPWYAKFLGAFRKAAEGEPKGPSDNDVRVSLEEALRPEPGFVGVDSVFADDGVVIYAVMTGDSLTFQRRTFALQEDGTVSLGKDAEEVRPVTRFEPVTLTAATAARGQGGSQANAPTRKGTDVNKNERIKALIATKKTCFTDADIPVLEQLSDERIKALEENAAAQTTKPAAPEAPVTPAATPVVAPALTEAQEEEKFLASAPPSIKRIVALSKAAEARQREGLLKALQSTTAKTVYTEAELKAMSTEQLEKLHMALGGAQVIDNSGRGLPRAAAADDEDIPAPPDMTTEVRAMRAAAKQ
jgi:hypothetical protein